MTEEIMVLRSNSSSTIGTDTPTDACQWYSFQFIRQLLILYSANDRENMLFEGGGTQLIWRMKTRRQNQRELKEGRGRGRRGWVEAKSLRNAAMA